MENTITKERYKTIILNLLSYAHAHHQYSLSMKAMAYEFIEQGDITIDDMQKDFVLPEERLRVIACNLIAYIYDNYIYNLSLNEMIFQLIKSGSFTISELRAIDEQTHEDYIRWLYEQVYNTYPEFFDALAAIGWSFNVLQNWDFLTFKFIKAETNGESLEIDAITDVYFSRYMIDDIMSCMNTNLKYYDNQNRYENICRELNDVLKMFRK